ncbi:MAG: hypothetical protein IKS49_06560 [Actinomycetaceae bacterium]|nr:hypothetical protein [Actinomycetaceae bacterium]
MSSTRSRALEKIALGEEEQARAEATRKRKARTIVVMGTVAGLLIAGLAFVGYNVYDIYASTRAKTEYESTYDAYLASVSQLDESLVSVSNTLNECRDSVADQKVCEDLEHLNAQGLELSNLRLEKSDIHAKTTREIRKEIKVIKEKQDVVEQAREALLAALGPVAQSQIDKIKVSINEAIEEAERIISQAQKIVDDTKDEVQNPATRDGALEAIQALRSQIEGVKAVTGTDTAAYVAALNSLNQATETVRTKANEVVYSHQLWEEERLRAEAEASASAEAEASAKAAEEEQRKAEEEKRKAEEKKEKGDKEKGDKRDKK